MKIRLNCNLREITCRTIDEFRETLNDLGYYVGWENEWQDGTDDGTGATGVWEYTFTIECDEIKGGDVVLTIRRTPDELLAIHKMEFVEY